MCCRNGSQRGLRNRFVKTECLAVIDSIQTVFFRVLPQHLVFCKAQEYANVTLMQIGRGSENVTMLIVGHVTKRGAIRRHKVLEHLVDTVLYFEGDRFAITA